MKRVTRLVLFTVAFSIMLAGVATAQNTIQVRINKGTYKSECGTL